ncbi:sensor histidine kinase [Agrococcus carbonis]|uniref:GAF domain-containing protein n=1 Tax=Agrococcus carbonis TaxID=684552 RepID=A0A1H1MXG5_9MICO|nr:GAF domain-containing protein [Agrococcus carbonis]SDR91543.1 GAF domain-containing protein [Agrococcus carbonis]
MTERREPPALSTGRDDGLVHAAADLTESPHDSQARLRRLLRVSQSMVEELDLEAVLRRIVEAAVQLVGAKYGALGVIAPDGHLERFIHVGIPEALAARMGELPKGLGLLGAIIDDPRPIRLAHLGSDPRSIGFPPHHPPMESFLGVPIRVRAEVFGNVYLTEAASGAFTADDEALLGELAATAGIAIDNARLFEESMRRQRWAAALAEITATLLSEHEGDPLQLVADRVLELAAADLACIVRPVSAEEVRIETAAGRRAAGLEGETLSGRGSLSARVIASGQPAMAAMAAADVRFERGSTLAVSVATAGRPVTVLSASRDAGRAEFSAAELEMAADFASQVGVALELAANRSDHERLALLEERARIAADLHDHVIQRLFAVGLQLQSIAGRLDDEPAAREQLVEQVESLDRAIASIRTSIFALTAQRGESPTLRHRVLDLLTELDPVLPLPPHVGFSGPVDLTITGALADDVLAAIREGLANAAKHAHARRTSVSLAVQDAMVTLEITDDGVGIGELAHTSGLANLSRRARRWDGDARLESGLDGGATLRWTAQVPAPARST